MSWDARCAVVVVFAVAVMAPTFASAALPAQEAKAARDRIKDNPVLQTFIDRVDDYRKLREQAEATVGSLPESANPAAITSRQHALGEAIVRARADARRGDIFTPAAAAEIKRLIARDMASRRPVDRQAFVVSQPQLTVRVNEFYPTSVPLATVPPGLLRILPPLPDGLEYRFVNDALILRDVDPNLVVDVLPDAVPARYRRR